MAGCDWGNPNEFGKPDGGLFYSIGCTSGSIKLNTKSCINLARICEYGVSLDETKEVANLEELQYTDNDDDVIADTDNDYVEAEDVLLTEFGLNLVNVCLAMEQVDTSTMLCMLLFACC